MEGGLLYCHDDHTEEIDDDGEDNPMVAWKMVHTVLYSHCIQLFETKGDDMSIRTFELSSNSFTGDSKMIEQISGITAGSGFVVSDFSKC